MSEVSIAAEYARQGFLAGASGRPSTPGTYHEANRRAYEWGYDRGRAARARAAQGGAA